MHDVQKAELIDAIERAETLDELFKAFSAAYRTASVLPDTLALSELTRAKDARKAALEAYKKDADFGVPA